MQGGGRLFVKFYSPKSPEKISWKFHEMRFLFFRWLLLFSLGSQLGWFRGLLTSDPKTPAEIRFIKHLWILLRRLRWVLRFLPPQQFRRQHAGDWVPGTPTLIIYPRISLLGPPRITVIYKRFRGSVSQLRLVRIYFWIGVGHDISR